MKFAESCTEASCIKGGGVHEINLTLMLIQKYEKGFVINFLKECTLGTHSDTTAIVIIL